ncbi:MAG: hypothetical protein WBA07_33640 [Rivularia sp. (in: cyanobacteria)]
MTEKFIVNASQSQAKSLLTEIIAIRKLIENRDVGDIVAQSAYDFVRATPHTVRLTVFYYSKKFPPYKQRSVRGATYNIPDITRSNASWTTIKAAMGGANGFMWGRFRASANLDNGRQAAVYGGSESEAVTRLKALVKLSSAKILTLGVTEERKEGLRATDKILYKPTIRMYPAYFAILSSQKIINESNKELTLPFGTKNDNLSGTFSRKKTVKSPVYPSKEPSYAKELITEMLRDRGTVSTS